MSRRGGAYLLGMLPETDGPASLVQAANASLKAALAQQEAHVKDLHAQAEAKAAESSGAESRRTSEQAQRVSCPAFGPSRLNNSLRYMRRDFICMLLSSRGALLACQDESLDLSCGKSSRMQINTGGGTGGRAERCKEERCRQGY